MVCLVPRRMSTSASGASDGLSKNLNSAEGSAASASKSVKFAIWGRAITPIRKARSGDEDRSIHARWHFAKILERDAILLIETQVRHHRYDTYAGNPEAALHHLDTRPEQFDVAAEFVDRKPTKSRPIGRIEEFH
jgi:hypothetical protein